MCASHLWSQSREICPELLERSLLCITYGQPLILFPEMEIVADRIPEDRFHAVFSVNDIVPRLMRYLDTSYSVWALKEMPEKFVRVQLQDKVSSLFSVLKIRSKSPHYQRDPPHIVNYYTKLHSNFSTWILHTFSSFVLYM